MGAQQSRHQSERATGVSDIAYDVMEVLTKKLKGVAAIEVYKADAEAAGDSELRAAFERIERRERESIEDLRSLLQMRLQRIHAA